jgi:predicted nucleotidyltransferase
MDDERMMDRVREVLRCRRDVRFALVFGSRARQQAGATSDLDIAVHAPGVDLAALAAEISRATGLEVDVVELDDAGIPLLDRVVREGIAVHESERGLLARWRARVLTDLETDRPWFRRMRDAWLRRVAERGV